MTILVFFVLQNTLPKLEFTRATGTLQNFQNTYEDQWLIADILREERQLIDQDFPNASHLILERGGTPLRSVIVTTWRSGSTFFGDLLNSLNGNFYHYEPLMTYETYQIRGQSLEHEAIAHIRKLLQCDYSDMESYMEFAINSDLFTQNTSLWTKCYPFCFNSTFVQQFCALFPMQSMKIVRIRLNLAEKLLADPRYVCFF